MKSKSKLVNVTRQKDATTFNMAVTNSTSLNDVVDLFFIAGASRLMPIGDIENMLDAAWAEDPILTLKLIFWAGNIRGGAGERRFFRIALSWLEQKDVNTLNKNLKNVPHFNRWDSLFHLDFDLVCDLIHKGLTIHKDGLLAKWMPRKHQYNNFGSKFRKKYKLSPKEYRNLIVKLSKTVEQDVCSNNWGKINYSHVPSKAMNKYRTAFYKHDLNRFTLFIDKVTKGDAKINAKAIFPYDLYIAMENGQNPKAVEAQWMNLPNYLEDSNEKFLPICDVSGSMSGLPMAISVSLGIYLSERNTSIFKDAFVTFSAKPKMQYLKGTLKNRMDQLIRADWDMNTDLNAVFDLILDRAVKEKLSSKDMPTSLLIISDMEFDACGNITNYENIENKYKQAGYKMPKIVFWNVKGRQGNVPVSAKCKNVALVSGASPSIMKSILSGKDFTPKGVMLQTLNDQMYSNISLA